MKKYILCVLYILIVGMFSFAQDSTASDTDKYMQVEIVQGSITTPELKKVGTVTIEYMPAYDEARVIYTCPTPLFEQSTAMLANKESILAFIKERGYYYYSFLKADDTRYNGETNMAVYTSYIKLLH